MPTGRRYLRTRRCHSTQLTRHLRPGLREIVLPQSLIAVGAGAFEGCTASVFYTGTDAQWNAIAGVSDSGSDSGSDKCTLSFYSGSEFTDGQHWHKVDGKPEIWQSNG